MPVEKAGSGSVESEDFNALVDAFNEGGNGGSTPGAVVVLGPYEVDFTDIPDPEDEVALVTLPVGAVVTDWWTDPETCVQFVQDQGEDPDLPIASTISVGQGVAFGYQVQTGHWGYVDYLSGADDHSSADLGANVVAGDHYTDAGDVVEINGFRRITEASEPIRVSNDTNVGFPLVAGHSTLYFAVAIPTLIVPS